MKIATSNNKIHPKLFALYLGMASMIMLFSSLCSALLVKRGDYINWENVIVPSMFLWSTILIIISSFSIHYTFLKFKAKNKKLFFLYGYITLILGITFISLQWFGFKELMSQMIFLNGNPSGSFLYVISGFHAFHYMFGILFLVFLLYHLNRNSNFEQNFNISILRIQLITQYWHFIGLVWIFLYLFFKFIIYNI